MISAKSGPQVGGHRHEVDYQKLGPALLIASSLVLAIRTARWSPTHSDGLANVEWDAEVEHSVRIAKIVLSHLTARYRRLSGLTIGIERSKAGSEETLLMPFIEESRLPNSVDIKAEGRGEQLLPLDKFVFGFKLGDRIFREVLSHHVPVPLRLL